MNHNQSLSVVIPTLGGESLRGTIKQLKGGTLAPKEILVCIPEKEAPRVQNLGIPGVRVIAMDVRGQVAQRARGFMEASGDLVLQLDDDIQLKLDCLERLVRWLHEAGPGNIAAPIYVDGETGNCVHRINGGFHGWLQSLYATTICGAPWGAARMGRATSIGVDYGVDGDRCQGKRSIKTDWLPGGCVLSFKTDLVKDAFFPFPGKAYCEDNIHSLLRRSKGLQHWVVPDARCSILVPKDDFPDSAWQGATAARRYYTRLNNGSLWRAEVFSALMRIHWFLLNNQKSQKQPVYE
jgi:glycosyltransferase involved in cell wall biosynthesis